MKEQDRRTFLKSSAVAMLSLATPMAIFSKTAFGKKPLPYSHPEMIKAVVARRIAAAGCNTNHMYCAKDYEANPDLVILGKSFQSVYRPGFILPPVDHHHLVGIKREVLESLIEEIHGTITKKGKAEITNVNTNGINLVISPPSDPQKFLRDTGDWLQRILTTIPPPIADAEFRAESFLEHYVAHNHSDRETNQSDTIQKNALLRLIVGKKVDHKLEFKDPATSFFTHRFEIDHPVKLSLGPDSSSFGSFFDPASQFKKMNPLIQTKTIEIQKKFGVNKS